MTQFYGEVRVTRTGELVGMRFGIYGSAREVWAQHAADRKKHEDRHEGWGVGEYSDTLGYLEYAATECEFGNKCEDWPLNADGTGEILACTPGVGWGEGDPDVDDPGLSYVVLTEES